MEESTCEPLPDLRDLESKVGRKTPEGLLRWLREDSAPHSGGSTLETCERRDADSLVAKKGLAEKIRDLRLEMAYLRSIDVKILQQLVAVNEGIEAVKWILEEKGTLTSRCSSLTSSQYSLVESLETSRRGSWNSLQDPNDKLDNISIGSYLDTLADEMDEYCSSTSEPLTCPPPGGQNGPLGRCALEQQQQRDRGRSPGQGSPSHKVDSQRDEPVWTKPVMEPGKAEQSKAMRDQQRKGHLDKPVTDNGTTSSGTTKSSPKQKPYKNGKLHLDGYKLGGKIHLEYDAHWRWVQSQDDVTFL
ncbi:leucine rich adaptor protein 1 [Polypterus senegalus]